MPADRDELRAMLEEAGRTWHRWRPRGATRPAGVRCARPEFIRCLDPEAFVGPAEAISLPPSPAELRRMFAVFGWLELIPLDPGRPGSGELYSTHGGAVLRRLCFLRSLNCPLRYAITPERPKYLFS